MSGFGRILEDLNRFGVRYVLIGGIALIRHGVVRATRDVDAVVAGDDANLEAIRQLVASWEATRPDGSPLPADDIRPGRPIHLKTPHGDVDLLPDGRSPLNYVELAQRSETRRVDGVPAPICSLGDLVALKRNAGRERDLADLSDLRQAHGELPDIPEP